MTALAEVVLAGPALAEAVLAGPALAGPVLAEATLAGMVTSTRTMSSWPPITPTSPGSARPSPVAADHAEAERASRPHGGQWTRRPTTILRLSPRRHYVAHPGRFVTFRPVAMCGRLLGEPVGPSPGTGGLGLPVADFPLHSTRTN